MSNVCKIVRAVLIAKVSLVRKALKNRNLVHVFPVSRSRGYPGDFLRLRYQRLDPFYSGPCHPGLSTQRKLV